MKELIELLESHSINKYYGVPDSLLGGLIEDICDNKNTSVDIVANEGIAIASAIGHFIAKKKMACVFMQNSGIGNAYNPLVSLAAKEIYSIPMILMIGWRAELDSSNEQLKDEPQHRLQGRITLEQLELMVILVLSWAVSGALEHHTMLGWSNNHLHYSRLLKEILNRN